MERVHWSGVDGENLGRDMVSAISCINKVARTASASQIVDAINAGLYSVQMTTA